MSDVVGVIEAIAVKIASMTPEDTEAIRRVVEMVSESLPTTDWYEGQAPAQERIDQLEHEVRDLRGRLESLQAQFDGLMSEEG